MKGFQSIFILLSHKIKSGNETFYTCPIETFDRVSYRLSSKEVVFNEERSNKLVNWKNEIFDLQDWLAKQEKRLVSLGEAGADLESIRKHKVALEVSMSQFFISGDVIAMNRIVKSQVRIEY